MRMRPGASILLFGLLVCLAYFSEAVVAEHSMQVKERHYEKVGEDYEQIHESYRNYHPAFTEGW